VKIVFTASGDDLNAPLDGRFGRAQKFLVYDLESKTFNVIDNQENLNAAQGAGIQSAETVARLGATVVVTGHLRCAHSGPGPRPISLRKAQRGENCGCGVILVRPLTELEPSVSVRQRGQNPLSVQGQVWHHRGPSRAVGGSSRTGANRRQTSDFT